jgi:hypothetical protein
MNQIIAIAVTLIFISFVVGILVYCSFFLN